MGFELINTHLENKGLQNPMLDALKQDAALYNVLLFQPVENLEYANDFIRISDRNRANAKFRHFFQLSIEQNAKLIITPEYSCPWEVVEYLIQNIENLKEDQLLIIGCESIKARELDALVGRNTQVEWIYEIDKVATNLNNDHFFDPVCYVFKTRSVRNKLKIVTTIQFKTHHFGGAGMEWERDNYIPGELIYVLENREESTRLITLICSDSLNTSPNFSITSLPQFVNHSYLIIHIQLNKAPKHPDYSQYRRDTFKRGWCNKEFICLNWGRNVQMNGENWNNYGGSAHYLQTTNDEDRKNTIHDFDERINLNHKAGLYYCRWAETRRVHVNFFNYDEHVFLYRSTKASQAAALPLTRNRTGPEMICIYSWDDQKNNWSDLLRSDDGFCTICDEFREIGNYDNLKRIYTDRPVDVERLIYLSVGKAQYDNWHLPTVNDFFRIKDDEIDNRITFTQDPFESVRQSKRDHLQQYGILEYKIISNPNYIPDILNDLKNNCTIKYRENEYKNHYNLNLFSLNEIGIPASGAFIGLKNREFAKMTLAKMIELFPNNHFGKRIVVWFSLDNENILSESYSDKPKITDNTSIPKRSIKSNTPK